MIFFDVKAGVLTFKDQVISVGRYYMNFSLSGGLGAQDKFTSTVITVGHGPNMYMVKRVHVNRWSYMAIQTICSAARFAI